MDKWEEEKVVEALRPIAQAAFDGTPLTKEDFSKAVGVYIQLDETARQGWNICKGVYVPPWPKKWPNPGPEVFGIGIIIGAVMASILIGTLS